MKCKILVFSMLLLCLPLTSAFAFEPDIDPDAKEKFKEMCDYMASLTSYSVTLESFNDRVFENGQKIQYRLLSKLAVQRPGKLRSVSVGDKANRLTIINNGKYHLYQKQENLYQSFDVPATLSEVMDFLLENFDIDIPTSDLLKKDPFKNIMPNILRGEYIGLTEVNGKYYHHLAFRQLEVDWQIWIEDGKTPLPRRLVIVDKTLHGNPQYMAVWSDWNVAPTLEEAMFTFTPPEGAQEGELLIPIHEEVKAKNTDEKKSNSTKPASTN